MKKVSLLALLSVIFALIIFTFSSCDLFSHSHIDDNGDEICDSCGEATEHKNHKFSEEWKYDAKNHYYQCEKCDEKSGTEAHIFKDGKCKICQYDVNGNHVHTYSDEWSSDEENHWHEATCDESSDCQDAKSDLAEHTFEDGVCTVCEYEDPEYTASHTHTYSNNWSYNASKHWHAATCNAGAGCATAKKNSANHTFANGKCTVCQYVDPDYVPPHVHTYSDNWSSDDAKHWHVATCDENELCATAINDVADHNFANGNCSVCGHEEPGYVAPHAHTYGNTWTFNESQHWHAAICRDKEECAIAKTDVADHNLVNGKCSICTYKIPTSTIAEALELAKDANHYINIGKLTTSLNGYTENVDYEFGTGYFHSYTNESGKDLHATDNGDGTVCFVAFDPSKELSLNKTYVEAYASLKYLQGVMLDLQNYTSDQTTIYGAYNLLVYLYTEYPQSFETQDTSVEIIETSENGVYKFTYTVSGTTTGVPVMPFKNQITCEFTLDTEKYFLKTLKIDVLQDDYFQKSLEFNQWERPETEEPVSQYKLSDIIPTAYSLKQNDGTTAIEFTSGTSSVINTYPGVYYVNISLDAPQNAMINLLNITSALKDKNGNDVLAKHAIAAYSLDDKSVKIDFKSEGTYYLYITIDSETYTIPFEVKYITPTSIKTQIFNDDPKVMNYLDADNYTMYVGQTISVGALLSEGSLPNAYTASMNGESLTLTLEDRDELNPGAGKISAYDFTASAPGIYTITFTSTKDLSVTTNIKITVLEAPSMQELVVGKWTAGGGPAFGGVSYTVNFYPQEGYDNTLGAMTVSIEFLDEVKTLIYKYKIVNGQFQALYYGGGENIGTFSIDNYRLVLVIGQDSEIRFTYEGETDPKPSNIPTFRG